MFHQPTFKFTNQPLGFRKLPLLFKWLASRSTASQRLDTPNGGALKKDDS